MNTNLQTTTNQLMLDFHQRNRQVVLAKEYDKGSRFIPIQCMEYGEPFKLDSSIEIQVKVLTPDNRALLEHSATIQDDGSILLELTENMLYYSGKANVELIFYDLEHKKRLSPMKFDLLIDSSAYPDDRIISSDEFNALNDLLEKATADYTYVITAARESANAAKISENSAASSANIATIKAREAKESADSASTSANSAYHSKTSSDQNVIFAQNSAKEAESWAHGNTGSRTGENTNNSKYWSEQSKDYANSWKGSLLPKGTIRFSQLPTSGNIAGHMYNINEAFITDSRFKDGIGYSYPSGTNVYWTQDGKWDCLSGILTREITQSQYDRLSNAEKMNGTIYYITDADNLITAESIGALSSNGGRIGDSEEGYIDISNTGIYGDNNAEIIGFNLVDSSILKYGGQDTDDRYVRPFVLEDIRELITTLATRLNALADSDDTTLDQLSEIVAYIKSNKSLIDGITTSKMNKAGDTMTGDLTLTQYLNINAWSGFGSGSAKAWYNGNTKTLDFEGDVKNIDLNATSATNADTVDGKHANDFVSKSGDSMIGSLYLNGANTVLSGEQQREDGTHNHALLIGHTQQDYWDFYEYGGIYNFYKMQDRKTLLGKITTNGWEGNVLGNLISSLITATFLQGNQGKAIINSTAPANNYVMLDRLISTNGYFTDGVYEGKRIFNYTAKSTVEANENKTTYSVTLLDEEGNSTFPGLVSASRGSFKGDIEVTSGRSNTLRLTVPAAGRIDEGIDYVQNLRDYKTFLGSYHSNIDKKWWNVINVRHGNGWNDGHYYGMYLRSELLGTGNLLWNKQMNNDSWLGERVLLDSVNYEDFCLLTYKKLTQAEYNALPSTKNNDNIVYFITD